MNSDKPIPRSYGSRDDRIAVDLPNGKSVNAIAGNEINTNDIYVVKVGVEYYVFANEPPHHRYSSRTAKRYIPETEVEVIPDLLPFQVLFAPTVGLGGDRNEITLSLFDSVVVGGINNLGNQEYLAVWLQDQIIQDNNGAQLPLGFPALFNEIAPSWIGNGLLSAIAIPQFPEVNLTESVVGDSIPFFLRIPLYDVVIAPPSYDILGITTNIQVENGYEYNKVEDYLLQNLISGNSIRPSPAPNEIPITCGALNAGQSETFVYERNNKADYELTIDENLSGPVQVQLNNQTFASDRTENYNETYTYKLNPSLFISGTTFFCQNFTPGNPFGIFDWVPTGNTIASWTGETSTIDRDYTRSITEEEWQRPVSLNFSRTQKHLRTEVGTEDTTYIIDSESWNIPASAFGFQYEVTGIETQNITVNITEDKIYPTTKLISGDGTAVLFTEEIKTLTSNFVSDRDRSIRKFLADNAHDIPSTTSHLETTTVANDIESESFYLAIGDNVTQIETSSSWLFSVISDMQLSVGNFTLVNDNGDPVFAGNLFNITQYTKVEDKVNESITYNNVLSAEKEFWATIQGSLVYIQYQGSRATGIVSSIDLQDEPDLNFAIQTIRTINSIAVQITAIEPYPQGLAEDGEILIYPVANCSVLLCDRVLNDQNKIHANLVNDTLYFSKSVIFDPSQVEQSAQVFLLGSIVTQEEVETGAFIPLSEPENILGTSYFPVE